MSADFLQRLLNVLAETPRDIWEQRVRKEFGGAEHYISRRMPQTREQINYLKENGIAPRTARRKITGR